MRAFGNAIVGRTAPGVWVWAAGSLLIQLCKRFHHIALLDCVAQICSSHRDELVGRRPFKLLAPLPRLLQNAIQMGHTVREKLRRLGEKSGARQAAPTLEPLRVSNCMLLWR